MEIASASGIIIRVGECLRGTAHLQPGRSGFVGRQTGGRKRRRPSPGYDGLLTPCRHRVALTGATPYSGMGQGAASLRVDPSRGHNSTVTERCGRDSKKMTCSPRRMMDRLPLREQSLNIHFDKSRSKHQVSCVEMREGALPSWQSVLEGRSFFTTRARHTALGGRSMRALHPALVL